MRVRPVNRIFKAWRQVVSVRPVNRIFKAWRQVVTMGSGSVRRFGYPCGEIVPTALAPGRPRLPVFWALNTAFDPEADRRDSLFQNRPPLRLPRTPSRPRRIRMSPLRPPFASPVGFLPGANQCSRFGWVMESDRVRGRKVYYVPKVVGPRLCGLGTPGTRGDSHGLRFFL
jgi:hypothetical protein